MRKPRVTEFAGGRWGLIAVAALAIAIVIGIALALMLRPERAPKPYLTTDILVLGDSQLSFGAGPVLRDFFRDLPGQCRDSVSSPADLERLAEKRFAMIGTRSTSLQSWVTSSGRAWELLCHKDKRWGVNASTWGSVRPVGKRYVQIGEDEAFQFCQPDATPLEQLFATGYYTPQLLMMFVGGNGAARLARDRAAAEADVSRFIDRLPPGAGCVFMMTSPIFSKAHNSTRLVAQANLREAFSAHGDRCTFVDGHTAGTRAAIEGQAQYFRRNQAGAVKDPYHANEDAARRFLELRRGALCRALAGQLRGR